MQNNLSLNFNTLISQLHENKLYIEALKNSSITYKIDSFKISNITPNMIKSICLTLKNKQKNVNYSVDLQDQIEKCDDQHWKINELKSFVWIAVCYSYLTQRHISQFEETDWSFLGSVFPQKSSQTIEYQANSLIRTTKRKNRLSPQESELFSIIMNQTNMECKWSQISKTLYYRSNKKLLLTPHKCREHWFNHLNAKIVHGQWSLEQDLKIFQQIQKLGFKWSKIAKLMGGTRTQHMVKNRFNSIISKWKIKHLAQPLQRITKKIIMKIKQQLIKNKPYISTQSLIFQQSKSTIETEQTDNTYRGLDFLPNFQTTTDIKQMEEENPLMPNLGKNSKYNQCQMMEIDESNFKSCFTSKSLLQDLDDSSKEPLQGYLKFW